MACTGDGRDSATIKGYDAGGVETTSVAIAVAMTSLAYLVRIDGSAWRIGGLLAGALVVGKSAQVWVAYDQVYDVREGTFLALGGGAGIWFAAIASFISARLAVDTSEQEGVLQESPGVNMSDYSDPT